MRDNRRYLQSVQFKSSNEYNQLKKMVYKTVPHSQWSSIVQTETDDITINNVLLFLSYETNKFYVPVGLYTSVTYLAVPCLPYFWSNLWFITAETSGNMKSIYQGYDTKWLTQMNGPALNSP